MTRNKLERASRLMALSVAVRETADELRLRPGGDDPDRNLEVADLLSEVYDFLRPQAAAAANAFAFGEKEVSNDSSK